jgi:hypothetical protein
MSRNFIKNVIYSLKKHYGSPAHLCRLSSGTLNVETGKSINTYDSWYIQRVVVPSKSLIKGLITRNRNVSRLIQGAGEPDQVEQILIFDKKDLPEGIRTNDFVYVNRKRFRITEIPDDYETDEVIFVKGIMNANLPMVFNFSIAHQPLILDTVT